MKKADLDYAVLYQGDCINTMEEIPDGSVDGLIIDPPYSSGGTFSTQRKTETGKWSRKWEMLANKACWAIEADPKRPGKVKIVDQEHAAELLDLANDYLS